MSKQVYKNPTSGQPLLSSISTACQTPLLEVKFCNLLKPYYYWNSPTIPRYSVTCVFDPLQNKDFLKAVQTIEKNEGVESIIKNETEKDESGAHVMTGNVLIKFQTKDKIPVFMKKGTQEAEPIELEDELAKGEKIMAIYDILRYTKKNTMKTEHGISFKLVSIYYYPRQED